MDVFLNCCINCKNNQLVSEKIMEGPGGSGSRNPSVYIGA